MKHINEISTDINQPKNEAEYSEVTLRYITAISKLYPTQTKKLTPEDLVRLSKSYNSRIVRYDNLILKKRLETLTMLIDALASEVKYFDDAIKVSVSNSNALHNLKRKYYPTGADATAMKQIKNDRKQLEQLASDDATAKAHIDEMKDLFKRGDK